MKRPTELIEKAKGFKSTDPIRVLAEYAVSLESPRKTVSDAVDWSKSGNNISGWSVKSYDVLVFGKHSKNYSFVSANSEVGKGFSKQYQVVGTREEFEAAAEAEVERRKSEESIDKKAEWYAIEVNKLFTAAKKDGIKLSRTDHGTIWEVIKPVISKAEAWDKLCEYNKAVPFCISRDYEVK